jgi:hypothetical protein
MIPEFTVGPWSCAVRHYDGAGGGTLFAWRSPDASVTIRVEVEVRKP